MILQEPTRAELNIRFPARSTKELPKEPKNKVVDYVGKPLPTNLLALYLSINHPIMITTRSEAIDCESEAEK